MMNGYIALIPFQIFIHCYQKTISNDARQGLDTELESWMVVELFLSRRKNLENRET